MRHWKRMLSEPTPQKFAGFLMRHAGDVDAEKWPWEDAFLAHMAKMQWAGQTWEPTHFAEWMQVWGDYCPRMDFNRNALDGRPLVFHLIDGITGAQERFAEGNIHWDRWNGFIDKLVDCGLCLDRTLPDTSTSLDALLGATRVIYPVQACHWMARGARFSAKPMGAVVQLLSSLWEQDEKLLKQDIPASHQSFLLALVDACPDPAGAHIKRWQANLSQEHAKSLDFLVARIVANEIDAATGPSTSTPLRRL